MALVNILVLGCLTVADLVWGYQVGVGRADVTGPIVEVTLMGYGKPGQKGTGLHTRQWSRAYIVGDGTDRLAFVNVDVGMMADGVRIKVVQTLEKMFGGIYNHDNVIISGTHTHSGVGGFMMHTFFDIPSAGFCNETFNALVSGIVESVKRAHENLREGKIFLATDVVLGVSVNRSPTSYMRNPKAERAKYKYDTDKELIQLRFVSKSGKVIGAINWFPVHGTSLNNTNTLVSSDNVGYASIALEQYMDPKNLAGKSEFVGSFASSNLGDVSPNTRGPKCHQSDTECDFYSKCEDAFEECYALGPGVDMYGSAKEIGFKLFVHARGLIDQKKGVEVTGPVKAIHQYVDMPKATAEVLNKATGRTKHVRGCVPAMGYSAGAGTTDGPFLPFLKQGMTNSTWWLDALTHLLARPTQEDIQCHAPKPILLASGYLNYPFEWQPRIVSTQLGRIGNVVIACVPGEFTTMAGRRMKEGLSKVFGNATVIIAGLCNTYSDYISTYEEYQAQRYEAASTLYGPHTLSLHLFQYKKLATALIQGKKLERGPEPQGLDPSKMVSFIPPVAFDGRHERFDFGHCLIQPNNLTLEKYGDFVEATFVSANPRNNLRLDDSYFIIEMYWGGKWVPKVSDSDWETKFLWRRTDPMRGSSEAVIVWTPWDIEGRRKYRIRHSGTYKTKDGKLKFFEGLSDTFTVQWSKSLRNRTRYSPRLFYDDKAG